MSTFAFLVLCVQACLLQNVYSQCLGPFGYGPGYGAPLAGPALGGWGAPGLAAPGLAGWGASAPYGVGLAGPANIPACTNYGGAGAGNVAVTGELPVGGATSVAGQVPIIGGVEFGGIVPAAGAVTISGTCACGCGSPYMY